MEATGDITKACTLTVNKRKQTNKTKCTIKNKNVSLTQCDHNHFVDLILPDKVRITLMLFYK